MPRAILRVGYTTAFFVFLQALQTGGGNSLDDMEGTLGGHNSRTKLQLQSRIHVLIGSEQATWQPTGKFC